MSARVISIANSKGGVGKTTTCVSLAEAFAAAGMRTLVIDLDTQANASLLIFGHAGDEHLFTAINDYATISDWLLENFFAGELRRLSEFIVTDASDVTFKGRPLPLDLIPSSPRLRKTERELIFELTAKGYAMEALQNQVGKRLRDDLNLLKADYDVILFDCPPGISVMTETVLAASHPAYDYLGRRLGTAIHSLHLEPEDALTPDDLAELQGLGGRGVMLWEGPPQSETVELLRREAGLTVVVLDPLERRPEGQGCPFTLLVNTFARGLADLDRALAGLPGQR